VVDRRQSAALALVGVGLAALAWWSLASAAETPLPSFLAPIDDLDALGLLPGVLDAEQTESARVIARYAARQTNNPIAWRAFARALIANAYGESKLRPGERGDSSASLGLFQLYTRGGQGNDALNRGYTVAQLLTAEGNADYFVPYAWGLARVREAAMTGDDAATTQAVTVYAERPRNAQAKAMERVGYLRALFGG